MQAKILVRLKEGVLDPQGEAAAQALRRLGFEGVGSVRIGREITVELDETDPARAREMLERMCEALLVNSVVETYEINLS